MGLYDKVTVCGEDDETESYQIVTTMRQDALHGLISKESPVGRAILGKKVGERVHIQVSDDYGYDVVIRSIEKAGTTAPSRSTGFKQRGRVPQKGFCSTRPV